jgi:hypothetical protein
MKILLEREMWMVKIWLSKQNLLYVILPYNSIMQNNNSGASLSTIQQGIRKKSKRTNVF